MKTVLCPNCETTNTWRDGALIYFCLSCASVWAWDEAQECIRPATEGDVFQLHPEMRELLVEGIRSSPIPPEDWENWRARVHQVRMRVFA